MVSPRPLRLAFFGTPDFAVPSLERLIASPHGIVAVVTQPDRPRNRGQRPSPSPVKTVAGRHGLPVLQPERLKDPAFLDRFRELAPDGAVVVAYGKILPDALLAIPRLGFVNVHASLLPRYRGAAPVARALLAGEVETGVTIMRVISELDAGPILAAARLAVGENDTTPEVESRLARMGAELLAGVLDRMDEGVAEVPQDHSQATYAPRLTREEGIVDWSRSTADIHNQVRALQPWPHAWSFLEGERLIIVRTRKVAEPAPELSGDDSPPGTIIAAAGDTLRVRTGSGAIDIVELQPEGRKRMPARAFLAGRQVKARMTLSSSPR